WVPLWLSYGIAAIVGTIAFYVWPQGRENAIRNMARVLGEPADAPAPRRMARRAFSNYAKYMLDMLRLSGIRPSQVERRLTVTGWDTFVRAHGEGTGLIFVGGHIGNSDLAAAILAGRGFPVHVIAEPLQPPRWDDLVQAARTAVGLHVIPLGSHAMRFLRVLRQKEILAFLIDRPVVEQGVTVRFFGRATEVPAGAAALALRSNAQILGAYIVRSGNRYVAEISPIISLPKTGDAATDLQALTQALFDWLERVIRQYPDQWFMFRPMWPAEG
ncbi:MAG: lysophospholipid acyltransferase family protein, partial [Chloroflexi bacterium]|nr:lysophospholipid acyltransferase family protein [Chloroflexota bacterium]